MAHFFISTWLSYSLARVAQNFVSIWLTFSLTFTYVSANLARKVTGFSEDDLQLLWKAIINMFEYDRSAARGNMAVRELIVFKHESELGNAPAYKLFDTIHVQKKEGVVAPRSYMDYDVTIDEAKMPERVTCIRMI